MNDLMAVERIAQCDKLKSLVLDSVSSPITKRVYNMALDEFWSGSSRPCGQASPRLPWAPGEYLWKSAT